jgi:plastocyanin
MRLKALVTIVVILVIAAGVFLLTRNEEGSESEKIVSRQESPDLATDKIEYAFGIPKKSAHYESNTPEHGSILAGAPLNIVINFNFDLAAPSSISITKDGKEYGTGELVIDSNKLSMRRSLDSSAPDGKYQVKYNACWPDRSCHDGNFEFAIDRNLGDSYEDMTDKKEVTIKMSEIMFKPKNIRISPNTKITWTNDEEIEHYVNTDSHPAHTYYPEQNSKALKHNESYSIIFTKSGIYPYHCSAHAHDMTANILVQ